MGRPAGDCMSFPMPDPPMALFADWEDWKEAALSRRCSLSTRLGTCKTTTTARTLLTSCLVMIWHSCEPVNNDGRYRNQNT